MRILVTFALADEFAPWRAMRKFESQKWGLTDAYLAQIGEAEVAVMLTGVGMRPVGFEFLSEVWNDSNTSRICVSSGLAGALRPEFEIGQVLAARSVGAEAFEDGLTDQTERSISSSASLVSFAADCGATVAGRFYTSGRVISRAEEKRQLARASDAVEMESYGILRAAAKDGIPAVAIRAISDTANEDLPLDMTGIFTEEGRVSVPRVIGQAALHPASIPGLVKLGKQSRIAAESLARFLDQYVVIVADRMKALEWKVEAASAD